MGHLGFGKRLDVGKRHVSGSPPAATTLRPFIEAT
jgi:hypothetical protein